MTLLYNVYSPGQHKLCSNSILLRKVSMLIIFLNRYNVNFEKERKLREYRHQMQPTWEEDIRLAKLKIYRRDLMYLAENLPYPVSSQFRFLIKMNISMFGTVKFLPILIQYLCMLYWPLIRLSYQLCNSISAFLKKTKWASF